MPKQLKAHLFLFIANLIYGANYTIAKEVMPMYIEPFGFIVIRVSIALALFTAVHRLFVNEKVKREDLPRLALCGIFGVAVNQLMFFKGLDLTTPVNASLMMLTTPILVLIISAIVIREKVTFVKISGILLGAAGAMTIVLYGHDISNGISASSGDFFVFINACSYGIYLVTVKPLLAKYHPVTVIKWIFIFGWFIVLPVGYQQFSVIE